MVQNPETGHARPKRKPTEPLAGEVKIEVEYEFVDQCGIRWSDLGARQKRKIKESAKLHEDNKIEELYEHTAFGLWKYFDHLARSKSLITIVLEREEWRASTRKYFRELKNLCHSYEQLNPIQRFLIQGILDDEKLEASAFMGAARVLSERGPQHPKPRRKKGGQTKAPELEAFAEGLVDNWCAATNREPSWSPTKGVVGGFLDVVLKLLTFEIGVRFRDVSLRTDALGTAHKTILNIPIRFQHLDHVDIRRAVERAVRRRRETLRRSQSL